MIALVQRHGVDLKKSGRSYKGLLSLSRGEVALVLRLARREALQVLRLPGRRRRDQLHPAADGEDLPRHRARSRQGARRRHRGRGRPGDAGESSRSKTPPTSPHQHFTERLWDPVRRPARARLPAGAVASPTIDQAPSGWAGRRSRGPSWPIALRERGLLAFGEKAGLCAPRQKGEGYYDMFRGRVIIPIRSPEGRTIAFGGRLLEGEDGPEVPQLDERTGSTTSRRCSTAPTRRATRFARRSRRCSVRATSTASACTRRA